ncbi:MAG: electron transfer flavoprotein subunit alpha/FixB family protein [Candidatus Obscuribacterales bacterium]|nr:electron transfer flavoprotein subunit alpha/FixB family protein [Candidatus Obscuribacterales bacterium]
MASGILVFVEQRNGAIRKASMEALSEARRQVGGKEPVVALIVGENVKALSAVANKCKPDKILVVDNAQFAQYSTEGYAAALSTAIKMLDPRYVFAANTSMSKDLLPRVAARLDAACVTDAAELKVVGDKIQAVHPMYSGKTRGTFELKSQVSFVTLRPNVFALTECENGHHAEIVDLPVSVDKIRAKVTETHTATEQKIELSEASIIVSGGRGIKGPENWGVLQNLCSVLGAALGASRAVVDSGWIDHQHQVGQTGKVVSPQLYIACGISGAIQHLAGMSSSKVIVAINKDPEAPIFKHATYGIVGDVFEVVPKLTEELKKQNA